MCKYSAAFFTLLFIEIMEHKCSDCHFNVKFVEFFMFLGAHFCSKQQKTGIFCFQL